MVQRGGELSHLLHVIDGHLFIFFDLSQTLAVFSFFTVIYVHKFQGSLLQLLEKNEGDSNFFLLYN